MGVKIRLRLLVLLLLVISIFSVVSFQVSAESQTVRLYSNKLFISEAYHMNVDREYVSSIFIESFKKDNYWGDIIHNNEYVRIKFEEPLDNTKDITIFPRIVSGQPRIEIYEKNSNIIISEFKIIEEYEYNTVYLKNLIGTQDEFDLKIVGGAVQFDHILDPAPGSCEGNWNTCTNAHTDDAETASVGGSATENIEGNWSTFGFSIPSTATIDTVSVRTKAHASKAGHTLEMRAWDFNGGTWLADHTLTLTTTACTTYDTTITGDKTWLYDDINNFIINYRNTNGGGQPASRYWYICYIELTVTYTDSNDAPETLTPTIISEDGLNRTSSTLNCSAVLNDTDADTMDVTVRWYENTTMKVETDYNNSYADGTTFSADLASSNTEKGDDWFCSIRTYDGFFFSGWGNSTTLRILNTPPTAPNSLTPTSGLYKDTVSLSCSGGTDADGAPYPNYNIQSNRTGTWTDIVTNDPDGSYSWDISTLGEQNNIDLRCNSTDTQDTSSFYNPSGTINIDSLAPRELDQGGNFSNGISPGGGTILFNATFNDTNFHTCTFEFYNGSSWSNTTNTTCVSEVTWELLKTTKALADETLNWSWWANDTVGNEYHSGYSTYTIGNTPPNSPTVLTPTTGTFNNTVIINCSGATDGDGDNLNYTIQTDVNGSWETIHEKDDTGDRGEHNWTITSYGEETFVDLRCAADDGTDLSSNYNPSGTITLDSLAPRMLGQEFNETVGTDQWVMFNVTFNDTTLHTCTFEFYDGNSWSNTTNSSCVSLVDWKVEKFISAPSGSLINWSWWANDTVGQEYHSIYYDFTVPNSPPVTQQVDITSPSGLYYSGEDLTCRTNITDADGGSVYANYTWWKYSTEFSSGQSSLFAQGSYSSVATLSAVNTAAGDWWYCSIEGYDGTVYEGVRTNSSRVVIFSSCNGQWQNCNAAYTNDANSANVTGDSTGAEGNWTGFGFNIPLDHNITSITVTTLGYGSHASNDVNYSLYNASSGQWMPSTSTTVDLTTGACAGSTVNLTATVNWTPEMVNDLYIKYETLGGGGTPSTRQWHICYIGINVSSRPPNLPPTVTSVVLEDNDISPIGELDLTPGTTTDISCNATVSDPDGGTDIDEAWGYLYRQDLGWTASDDPAYHYTNNSCTVDSSYGTNLEALVDCNFKVQFYADNGTWECNITVNDTWSHRANLTDTSFMNSLLAIDINPVENAIEFPPLQIGGDTGSVDTTEPVINIGNTPFDVALNSFGATLGDGLSMTCDTGTLDDSNLRYSLTPSTAYNSKTQFVSDANIGITEAGFDLEPQTSGSTGSTRDIHFGMGIQSGESVVGRCEGTLMFTAIPY